MLRYLKYFIFIIFASIALIMIESPITYPVYSHVYQVYEDEWLQLGYSNNDIKLLNTRLTTDQLKRILKEHITRYILFSYLQYETFSFDDITDCEKIRNSEQVSFKEALNLKHHPYLTSEFYTHMKEAINIDTNLILVNKNYYLSKDYIPKNLVFTQDLNLLVKQDTSRYYLQSDAYYALKALFTKAEKSNFIFYISNGYRSYEKQAQLYNSYLLNGGNADLYSARPGHSEHQSGLAVDITCKAADYLLTQQLQYTDEGVFIKTQAYHFGFIERYPKDKEEVTGYMYEPWHLRYVGVKVATIIYQENLTLEEYLLRYTLMPIV